MTGAEILQKTADLRLEGMIDGDEIGKTLLAATFADAMRKGLSPRQVLDAVWEHVPSDDDWEAGIRDLFTVACDAKDLGVESEELDEAPDY